MKRLLLAICAAGLATFGWTAERTLPPPDTSDGLVFFSADQADADPQAQTVNLKGNVHIIQKTTDGQTRTAVGEDITFDQKNTTITSVGPMKVEGMGGTLEGNNVSVNYQTKDFYAENTQTEYPPLRVLSAEELSSNQGTVHLKNAVLTCCDQTPPHYTITLGKAKMSPQKRVFGTNAVFKLDGVPMLWLPVYWRSLESQKPWTTYVDFTKSHKTGVGILTSTVLTEIPVFRPTIHLDYYTKSGFGTGLTMRAIETETLKGTGEFYYINDHSRDDKDYIIGGKEYTLPSNKRWGMRGGYWWELYDSSDHFNNPSGALYQFQTQFRMVSDPYFNDNFFRGNPYIFMSDQQTDFSLSRQSRRSTLRISYTQQDVFNWNQGSFIAKTRNMPQLEYNLMPFKDPLLGLNHHMEVTFNNTSLMETTWQRKGHARWTTEKAIRLHRNLTFTPAVFYDQSLTLQDPAYRDQDAWVGRVGTDMNMQTHTPLGTIDFGYQYTRRLSTGTISLDRVSADQGEEKNRLYVQNYFRPTFQTYLRLGGGFSLINHDGVQSSWQHLKERIEPVLVEGGYTSPGGQVSLFIQDLYDVIHHNQALIAQTNFRFWGQSLGVGVANYDTYRDPYSRYQTYSNRYFFSTMLGLRWPDTAWRLSLGTDFRVQDSVLYAYNKVARLSAALHDAKMEFIVKERNDNLSFSFQIRIICGKGVPSPAKTNDDDEFFPWNNSYGWRDM